MIPLIPSPVGWGIDQAKHIAEDWLIDLAGKAGQSAQLFLEKTATFWVTGIKSPQLTYATDQNPYTPASTVGYLWAHLHWYVSGLAVLSIFIAAGKMAWQRNGAPGRELLQSILTLMVVSSAGVATISLMTTASDEAASYILTGAMTTVDGQPSDFQIAFGAMFIQATTTSQNAFVLIGLYSLVLIGSIIQVALLIIRGGMLFLLAGVLPLAAAATNTETGRQWFRKSLAWTIAFILYKPVAAIVYATAFQLTREGSQGVPSGALAPTPGDPLLKIVTGVVMCFLAIFALPALMRFTTPAVAAAAGGGGGGGLALGGALAMGAKAAMSKVNGGGGGGGKSGGGGGKTGGESSSGGGPQGNSMPGGGKAPAGQAAGKSATTKAGAAAGPVGAVAAGVADGLKKVSETANSAVSHAAGEETPGSTPGRSNGPGRGGKGPSGGPSPKGKPPAKTPPSPPADNGPTGSQQGKATPPTKPPTTEGPSGGKRH